jgi:hypothetical protein
MLRVLIPRAPPRACARAQLGGAILEWHVAAPMLVAHLAFGTPLSHPLGTARAQPNARSFRAESHDSVGALPPPLQSSSNADEMGPFSPTRSSQMPPPPPTPAPADGSAVAETRATDDAEGGQGGAGPGGKRRSKRRSWFSWGGWSSGAGTATAGVSSSSSGGKGDGPHVDELDAAEGGLGGGSVGGGDDDGAWRPARGARPVTTILDGDDSEGGSSLPPYWHYRQHGQKQLAAGDDDVGLESADGADSLEMNDDSVGLNGCCSSDAADDASFPGEGGALSGVHLSGVRGARTTRPTYRKTLRPSPAQLASLNLKAGANSITFSVTSALQGTQNVCARPCFAVRTPPTSPCHPWSLMTWQVSARIFLFDQHTKLVISDVDGTITRSDVLGHILPRVGYEWAHNGVASLYSRIVANGYSIMYLTARGIGMATTTREYLASVQQGEITQQGESHTEESKL